MAWGRGLTSASVASGAVPVSERQTTTAARIPYGTGTQPVQRPAQAATSPSTAPQYVAQPYTNVQQTQYQAPAATGGGGFDLSQPGRAEQAYTQNAAQLQRPSYGENFLSNAPGYYDQGLQSTASGQYWNQIAGSANAPRIAGQGYVSSNLGSYSLPAQYAQDSRYGTATEQVRGSLDPGGNNVGQYDNQTFTGQVQGRLDPGQRNVANNTMTGAYAGNFNPAAGAPRNVAESAGQTSSGRYASMLDPFSAGPANADSVNTAAQQNYQGQQSSLPADMSSYYDRQFNQGSERLDRAMAARGMFGSSAALEQQRDLAANLGAQQARDEAQYGLQRAAEGRASAQAADQSQLARFGTESNVGLARQGLGLEAAQAADDAAVSRFGTEGQLGVARQGLGLEAMQGADAANLARYLGETGYDTNRADLALRGAMGADQAALGRFGAETDYALGRGDLNLRGAMGADQAGIQNFLAQTGYDVDRTQLGLDAASFADQNDLARFMGQGQLGLDQQRLGLDAARQADLSAQGRYSGLLDAAQGADRSMIDRLSTLGQGALAADNSRLNRVDTVYNNLLGTTTGLAGGVSGMYDDYFNSDLDLFGQAQQMGLGAGLQNLAGTQAAGAQRSANTANAVNSFNAGNQEAAQVAQMIWG